ncbi:MAG: hypothetical protein GY815_11865 [Gammaproteobacteria bacterium]|nr:hypothetical protein [Gammaproteobacteria bacterium]
MDDPYKTPKSDVEVLHTASKTKWKVFFWIILILEIISIGIMAIDPDVTAPEIIIELIVYPIIVIGIFGFAYGRRIFFRKLWISMIPIGLAFDTYTFYTMDWDFESPEEMYSVVISILVIGIPLMFLQYFALYKYGSKSPEIWQSSK